MRAIVVAGFLLLAMVAAFLPAHASPMPPPLAALDIGNSNRVRPEMDFKMLRPLSARAEATLLMPIESDRADGAGYRSKTRFQSGRAMMKLHPFDDGFFLSGGARLDRTDGRTRTAPAAAVRLGSNFVSTNGRVVTQRAAQESASLAPSFSMGYGAAIRPHLNFGFEAGTLFGARDHAIGDRYVRFSEGKHSFSPMLSMKLGYRF